MQYLRFCRPYCLSVRTDSKVSFELCQGCFIHALRDLYNVPVTSTRACRTAHARELIAFIVKTFKAVLTDL